MDVCWAGYKISSLPNGAVVTLEDRGPTRENEGNTGFRNGYRLRSSAAEILAPFAVDVDAEISSVMSSAV